MTTNRERAEELRERVDAITSRLGLAFDQKERATTAIWEALCAAERRGIALGRAAERRDVVAWLRDVREPDLAYEAEHGAHLPDAKEKPDADE